MAPEIGATMRIAFFLVYCVPLLIVLARWPRGRVAEVGAVLSTGCGLFALLVLAGLLVPPAILRRRGERVTRRWQYAALRASVLPMALTLIGTFTRVVESWTAFVLSAPIMLAVTVIVYEIAERHFPEYAGRW